MLRTFTQVLRQGRSPLLSVVETCTTNTCSGSETNIHGINFEKDVEIDCDAAETERLHIPVMMKEVLDVMQPKAGQVFLDMTFGGGGHTKALLGCEPNITVFALDRDPSAHTLAEEMAKEIPNVKPLLGKFTDSPHLLKEFEYGENSFDGILFDVGASSMQFDSATRGFAVSRSAVLDMRMDQHRVPDQPTAAEVVNYMDDLSLFKIIKAYGEEKYARQIARAIVDHRNSFGKITTTKQLADVVGSVFEGAYKRDKLNRRTHVATKTFQALRIFVNNELNELHNGLQIALHLLKPGGVCAAISFHSLEDRIVKRNFHSIDMDAKFNQSFGPFRRGSRRVIPEEQLKKVLEKQWTPLYKKIVEPSEEEIERNPRSRSAKLRAARKN